MQGNEIRMSISTGYQLLPCRILDKYAASVIDLCFENDRDFAVNILRRPAPAFYDVQPLPLALKANCQRYLASKCVQRYLDNEW